MIKILLIDDDKQSPSYLKNELTDTYHCEVTWIKKAEEAIPELIANTYDAIILDIMMPIPDSWTPEEIKKSELGLETGTVLFEQIRKIKNRIPILIISAKEGKQMDDFSYYIRKPETIVNIVAQLKKLIKDEN